MIFITLLTTPLIATTLKQSPEKITLRSLSKEIPIEPVAKIVLIIAVISSILVIPAATFTPEAEPQSLTGRNFFPDEQVHTSLEWTDTHTIGSQPAVTGTLFFAWEERYRNPASSDQSCFYQKCSTRIVFWHDDFEQRWYSLGGGYYSHKKENITLSERDKTYDAGNSSVYFIE
jgi:hypothetical protein